MTRPRHAATIILMRPRTQGDFAVFMVKRHARSGFMANAYVYPGGRLDPEDSAPELAELAEGLDDAACITRLDEPDLAPELARGLFLAGIRESFEEAGVLLAQRPGEETLVSLDDAKARAHFNARREALHAGTQTLLDIAREAQLRFPLNRLYPFAHWITPEVEPKRYDTRFFVAQAPERQTLSHDDIETVDSVWITPAEALTRYSRGDMQLAPPTLCTLEELNQLGTLDAVIASARERSIPNIMPAFTEVDGVFTLLLPGHPEHPDHDPTCSGPSHIVLEEGRWWSR